MSKFHGLEYDVKNGKILSVQINLLNTCTSKCKYCKKYTWPRDYLDYDVLKKTLKFLKNQGLKTVVFSGGDPILYPQLIKLLKYCKKLGVSCSLITTLITNNKFRLQAIAKYATRIHCSVDAANRDLYKDLRGVSAFGMVKHNIKYVNSLREGKIKVRISSTISNENYKEIVPLYEFAKETDSTINYYFVHEHEEYFLSDCEKMEMEKQLYEVVNMDSKFISNAVDILSGTFTKDDKLIKSKTCKIPFIHCLINANGDIYPCCKLLNDNGYYGEQVKYVYGNIYNKHLDKEFAKRFREYDICNYCNGCEERYINIIDEVNEIMQSDIKECFL